MSTLFKVFAALLVLGIALIVWPVYQLSDELSKASSEDPLVWEENIRELEQRTAGSYDPGEAVVFVGSSSIRFWETLAEDMAPIPVIQHGFGGAKLNDVLHYAKRLVNNYQPRAVVVFAGTNDIQPGDAKSPEVLLASYQALVQKMRAENANLPIYFIAITPSPLRWEVWDIARETNALIREWSASQRTLYVIDTSAGLLSSSGEPDPDNYIFDGLHLSKRGYQVWTRVIKPPLIADLGLAN